MEAERNNRDMEWDEDAEEDDVMRKDYFTRTHQYIEHLKKHSPKAPPVHCWTVWVAL